MCLVHAVNSCAMIAAQAPHRASTKAELVLGHGLPEFDTYDTQVIDSYRTSIKTADYKKGLVRSVGVG